MPATSCRRSLPRSTSRRRSRVAPGTVSAATIWATRRSTCRKVSMSMVRGSAGALDAGLVGSAGRSCSAIRPPSPRAWTTAASPPLRTPNETEHPGRAPVAHNQYRQTRSAPVQVAVQSVVLVDAPHVGAGLRVRDLLRVQVRVESTQVAQPGRRRARASVVAGQRRIDRALELRQRLAEIVGAELDAHRGLEQVVG